MTDRRKEPGQGAPVSLGSLPRDITPPRDLWPAIEAAIGQQAAGSDGPWTQLPQDVPPPHDLWPGIVAGIEHRAAAQASWRPARWLVVPRLAAGVAIVAITGALLLRLDPFNSAVGPEGAVDPEGPMAAETGSGAVVAGSGATDPADSPGQAAGRTLDDLLASGVLGPEPAAESPMATPFQEARRLYAEQISMIRSQRETIESSLEAYPEDPALLEHWMDVYEAELLLIDEASRVLTGIQTGWYS